MIRMNARRRPGFTLVELMIAAAITVLIMTILSICFQTSMQAMSSMRAQGDAADQLRAVGEVMKRDFKADHFLPAENAPFVINAGRRLSDYRYDLWDESWRENGSPIPAVPPPPFARGGFYYLFSPASTFEGNDGQFDSFRNANCSAWFTSTLVGGNEANLYSANVYIMVSGVPTQVVMTSEAAEVAYFLVAIPGQFTAGPGGLPLYNLYRRQRLLATNANSQALFQQAVGVDPNVSDVISTFTFPGPPAATFVNTMSDVAQGRRPAAPTSFGIASGRFGDDIVLSNVISFEIKPTWVARSGRASPPGPAPNVTPGAGPTAYIGNTDYPYDNLTAYAGNQFDTLANPAIRINGVQVRLRIYDQKVKTARQSTFIFDQ